MVENENAGLPHTRIRILQLIEEGCCMVLHQVRVSAKETNDTANLRDRGCEQTCKHSVSKKIHSLLNSV